MCVWARTRPGIRRDPEAGREIGVLAQGRDREVERPCAEVRPAEHEGEVGGGERGFHVAVGEVRAERSADPARERRLFAVHEEEELVSTTTAGVRAPVGVDPEQDPAARPEPGRLGQRDVDCHPARDRMDRHPSDVGRIARVADRVVVDREGSLSPAVDVVVSRAATATAPTHDARNRVADLAPAGSFRVINKTLRGRSWPIIGELPGFASPTPWSGPWAFERGGSTVDRWRLSSLAGRKSSARCSRSHIRRDDTPVAAGFVQGDPGCGKSRLLAEVVARAGDDRCLQVTGYEAEQAVPLAAASGFCAPLSGWRRGGRLEDLVFGRTEEAGSLDPLRVFEATHRALRALGRRVLVVDDVQWVDALSLALLHYLVRAAVDVGQPLALVTASRPSADADRFAASVAAVLPPTRCAGSSSADCSSRRVSPSRRRYARS